MNKKVTKAVFPVAGLGSRFLPATKAMPKELLPIIDKPIIQFAVEEAVRAGIDTMIFVTGRNKRAIEDHFDANLELEYLFNENNKHHEVALIKEITPPNVQFIFIRQAKQLGLGHAVLCAERVIGNDPFAVLLADDFIYDGKGGISGLVQAYHADPKHYLSVMPVEEQDCSKYGIVDLDDDGKHVKGLIEKPDAGMAPSNLASIGRYLLEPSIFNVLKQLKPGHGNEIQLADAINIMAKSRTVKHVPLEVERFDCGSKEGYLSAILSSAYKDKRFKNVVERFTETIVE